jgi:uncharacterized protein (TIGR03435 family)
MNDFTLSGPRLTVEASSVPELIMYAYDLKPYQVALSTSPHETWYGEVWYDIAAKAEGDATPSKDEFRAMVRSLLADRFKLQVHREKKEMPVYALVVAKNGPKLKPSANGTEHQSRLGVKGRNYEVTMHKVTMDEIISMIRNAFLDRPVVDQTGLRETYDATLTYTPNLPNRTAELTDISIFSAVEEQLGLKLAPQKAMIDMLIVDHVEKPSEN